MAEANSGAHVSTARLILVPGLITLAVTILRLVGELEHWSQALFNPAAGGPGAIVGIVWLGPIFGIYFALKLSGAGEGLPCAGKTIGFAVLGLVVTIAGAFLAFGPKPVFPGKVLVGMLIIVAAVALQLSAWPALAKTLIAYGYAARIPVAIVMYFAIRGNWGTHYDAPPPEYPPNVAFWTKYFQIALLPQLIFWVAFTVMTGALFGSIVTTVARRRKPLAQPAA